MNKFALLTITILASACGDGVLEPPTFGEAAEQLSVAFCERSIECNNRTPEVLPYCIDHNITSLCNIWDCAEQLEPEQVELVDQCAIDLRARDCTAQLSSTCLEELEL